MYGVSRRTLIALRLTLLLYPVSALSQSSPCVSQSSAGTPPPQVVVDVVVTDEVDQPIKGLLQSDFHLSENGKPQQITCFEAHNEPLRTSRRQDPLPRNTFTNRRSTANGSINIILLDQVNTAIEDQEFARVELMKFFRNKPAGTRFAIFALRDGTVGGRSKCVSCDSLHLLQGVTANRERLIAALNSRNAQPRLPALQWQRQIEDTTMPALAGVAQWLKDLPGRKRLIWVAGSFDAAPVAEPPDMWFPPKFKGWKELDPFSRVQMLHFATGRLRLSRVALYPIDITARSKKVVVRRSCIEVKEVEDGVYFFLGLCENFGPKIDTMAEQTGGRAFHTRDLQAAVLQAVNDASTYYTLFYLPRHLKFDGKIRSIKTGTTLKNARLRYRRKYFADDPGAILQPDDAASADMVIDRPTGAIPWTIVRVTKEFDSVSPSDPILAGMRYGTPASRAVVFTARVRAEDKPSPASRQQMDELQEFESFFPDRVRRAVSPEVAKFAAKPDSFRRGHARIESLPSLEPEVVQPFSIDYSIPLNQLGRRNANDGRTESDMEIAILGYDELGKKVTGLKQTVQLTIAPFQSTQSPDAEFLHTQTIHLPARTAFLRLAVRDIVAGNVGSFEIPMWAVDNPYERKRLEFPVDLENSQPSGN